LNFAATIAAFCRLINKYTNIGTAVSLPPPNVISHPRVLNQLFVHFQIKLPASATAAAGCSVSQLMTSAAIHTPAFFFVPLGCGFNFSASFTEK
jgi:hypothetical protein